MKPMFSIGRSVNKVSLSLRLCIKQIRERSSKGNYTKCERPGVKTTWIACFRTIFLSD